MAEKHVTTFPVFQAKWENFATTLIQKSARYSLKLRENVKTRRCFQFTLQLSTSQTSVSPQRKVSDNSLSTPEKNNSKESLSTSVWSQVSTKPVEGTPRTSTPELRKSASPRVERQSISGFHHESALSKVDSRANRRRPFYVSVNFVNFPFIMNSKLSHVIWSSVLFLLLVIFGFIVNSGYQCELFNPAVH